MVKRLQPLASFVWKQVSAVCFNFRGGINNHLKATLMSAPQQTTQSSVPVKILHFEPPLVYERQWINSFWVPSVQYCRRVIRQNWNTWSKAETQEKALSIPIFIFFQFQQPFAKSEDFATSSKTLCPLKRKCHLLIPCDGYWIQEVLVKDSAGPSTHSDVLIPISFQK